MKTPAPRSCLFVSCLFALLTPAAGWADPAQTDAAPNAALAAKIEWWRQARFGMFVHWGPVSLKGTEIGWSRGDSVPIAEYDTLYQKFNPTRFDADEWVALARAAGMKYLVFTTKHHDGFCMWDTRQTGFSIAQSPFGRDVVKELSLACRRQNLAFGTYHSVCDWHHPDFPLGSPGGRTRKPNPDLERYTAYLRSQVAELITGYGPLLVMWFDVPQEFDAKRGQALIDWTRSLQPDIIVNNRSGAAGDYDTPEQRIGGFQNQRPWETCMTLCQQWAWKPNDTLKPLAECVRTLVRCAGGDGNLLLNVGPMPDGRIEPRQADRLKEIGAWLTRHGDSIYATRGGPWKPTRTLASTRRDRTVYLHVFEWPEVALVLPSLPCSIQASSLLTGGSVEVRPSPEGLRITVPPGERHPIDTIVKIELDRPALELEPIAVASPGLKTTASNVYHTLDEFGPENAFDRDPATRWATDAGTHTAWIAVDFAKPRTFRQVRIQEAYAGRVRKFELQSRAGSTWTPFYSGTSLGADLKLEFAPVTAREFRLDILEATEGPTLNEIEFGE